MLPQVCRIDQPPHYIIDPSHAGPSKTTKVTETTCTPSSICLYIFHFLCKFNCHPFVFFLLHFGAGLTWLEFVLCLHLGFTVLGLFLFIDEWVYYVAVVKKSLNY